ncbi:molybdopterin molybdotransferase [Mariprofundus micogutta]|uniref:Molybdopterin molybdenumtransferase n=1 Tax=Mariprofundus micogutta TaxID=1921010 RepID=A0A1L8CQD9_9PROT|nr:gephyrin-like molybdotransferase Glp [Mariprofundus micogutta]GAV21142.1 molybdopterin molybdotransferase [Mariprofundus micogutta]
MSYLAVDQAQACILEHLSSCAVESVALNESLGRVVAEDIYANRNHPPYDVSAMDGYAVRFEDLVQISEAGPAELEIIDDIRAGQIPSLRVLQGRSARIMTGAPVPAGADTVIRVEDTELDENIVSILVAQKCGTNIRPLGENLRDGEVVLEAGITVTPGVLAILAMVKQKQVPVFARPTVAILSTGDELEGLDEAIDENKIPDANSYALMAQCQALGIKPVLLGIARDNPIEIRAKLTEGLKYDVLLASGGVSVGHHDFMRPMLEELGVQVHFWRVAMRPGHPLAFGTTATGTAVFGLPGNPVSSMVCFEQFAAPALKQMMGFQKCFRRTITARLTHDMKDREGRTHFVRVSLSRDDLGYLATSTGTQGSGVLMSMALAEGLMIVPAAATSLKAGETVVVQLLQDMDFQEQAALENVDG